MPATIASARDVRGRVVSRALDNYEKQQARAIQQVSVGFSGAGGDNKSGFDASRIVAKAMAENLFSFAMGLEVYDYKYEETVGGEHFMDLQDRFQGFYGTFTCLPKKKSYFLGEYFDFFQFDGRVAWGQPDYNGTYQLEDGSRISLTAEGSEDFVFELRGLLGRNFSLGSFQISPFTGIGYRRLRDNSSKMVSTIEGIGLSGYDRISHYTYWPLGVGVKKDLPGQWSISMNAEYDYFIYGQQRSNLTVTGNDPDTGAPLSFPVMNNDQYKGYGLRAGLRLEKAIGRFGFSVEPFIRFWDLNDSNFARADKDQTETLDTDWVIPFYEPSNTTQEIGMKMGMIF